MNYLLCLYLSVILIIKYSYEQKNIYCDVNQDCDTCSICGSNTNNYCSCNFYNIYCKNIKLNTSIILSDFLFSYDGCLKSNGNNQDICGNSNQNIDIGVYKTITFKSSSQSNYVCFYNIKKVKNNNNDVNILVTKETNIPINFNMHFVIYYNNDRIKISSRINSLSYANRLEMVELEVEKISLYVDIPEGTNMDKISISFGMDNMQVKVLSAKKSKDVNDIIMYACIFGSFGILLIVLIVYFVTKYINKRKDNKIKTSTQNQTQTETEIQSQMPTLKTNKDKIDNMFKGELKPEIYKKLNNANHNFNCTICLEDFKDGQSQIVETKCHHTFHYNCFKNWVYKNMLFPKCPNCNTPILESDNKNNLSNNINRFNSCYTQSSFNTMN